MTAAARDGRDGAFSAWLRGHPDLDSNRIGIVASDIDMTFLKFKTFVDCLGTRDVKLLMDVEVKTFGAEPGPQQLELLCFRDKIQRRALHCWSTYLSKAIRVWSLGHFMLRIVGGERPDACTALFWHWFESRGVVRKAQISEEELVSLLSFDLHPRKFEPLSLRRHHKTQRIMVVDNSGLFPVERFITKRS